PEGKSKGGAAQSEVSTLPSLRDTFPGGEGKWDAAQTEASLKEKIGLSDFANNKSPVWRNVEYEDDATKASITKETHDRMVGNGQVVTVSDETMADVGEMFPDLRGMKKKERIPLIKQAMNTLKNNLRNYLSGLTGQNFEFEVNGKILEAKLYSTGINEVLEKVTKEKANMLYVTEGIFQNAQYLYSTPDYDGNPNIYRWNYFYTPVKIGEETVGVRIAVRDMAMGTDNHIPESQIYNWGIKKDVSLDGGNYDPKAASSGVSSDTSDTSLDGVGRGTNDRISHGVSSDTSDNIVPEIAKNVKSENDERRNIAFTEDILAYRGANARGTVNARTTVQNAIESGILNDTGRTHEFVDLLAKLSSDKGIIFDFTNNARLAEKGLSLKDVTVNGYADKNGITVNVDSVKYLNTVVGHEITHVFEGTELYGPLRTALFECAITKGEFETRYAALQKLYANVEGADISAELTADLVGDYIFTDAEFVKSLAAKHRNVFQRIFDEIKYLCKIVTAGSREARELEKAKKIFAEAYRAGGESANAAADAKYSLSETTDGKIVAVVDNDILKNIDTTSWDKTKKEAAKKAASDALKKFGHGIVVDGITRKVNKISRDEYTRSNNTERMYRIDPKVFADKMRAADAVDDIVVAATNWNRDGGLKHPRNDNFADFDHGQVLIMSGNAKYTAEVVVGITDSGDAVFYDVADMTPTTFDIKKSESSTAVTTQNAIDAIQEDSVGNSLSQTAQNVKRKNALSENTQTQKRYGDYNVSGEDVKLEDIAPVREDAPMREETAPYNAEGNKTSSTASGPPSPEGKAKGGAAQTEVSPLPSLRDT
ncbi:MAG: hypothetical protein J6C89_00755, partial [Clostridia bacterium]|nr:hypothetical protein [Clostridia bacterium]